VLNQQNKLNEQVEISVGGKYFVVYLTFVFQLKQNTVAQV